LRVSAGDQIGLMGKSGNARNTPAHLHIGIYDGGWGRPVDPWYFFVDGESEPPAPPEEEVAELGAWVRTAAGGVSAVTHPPASWGGVPSPAVVDARGNPLRSPETPPTELSRGEEVTLSGLLPVRASGIRGDDLRVLTVDGQVLYADRASIEPLTQPVATLTVRAGRYLRTAPSVTAPVIGRTDADTELEVLGFHESYAMVRGAGETRPAWLWLPERGGRTL
jgi:murein DD-endopeptidase MepM/ murein hydrolase activator NlpD